MSKPQSSTKAGISPLIIILIVAAILFLGVGGYFFFDKVTPKPLYVAPIKSTKTDSADGPVSKAISDIATGENSTTFVIFKNYQSIKPIISQFPIGSYKEDLDTLKSALIVVAPKDNSDLKAYLEFDSETSAQHLKDTLLQSSSENGSDLTIQGSLLIYSSKKEGTTLTGKFSDNQKLKKISQYQGAQLVGYINYNDNFEMTNSLYSYLNTIFTSTSTDKNQISLIPTAHAQFLSNSDYETTPQTLTPAQEGLNSLNLMVNYAREGTFAITASDQNIKLQINTTFLDKASLSTATVTQITQKLHPNTPYNAANDERTYSEGMAKLKANLPSMLEQFKKVNPADSGLSLQSSLNGLVLSVNFQINTVNLKKLLAESPALQQNAAAQARDKTRKNDLQNIAKALYGYKNQRNKFPTTSNCLENIGELFTYFQDGNITIDPQGKQNIGGNTCQNGYYYQTDEKGSGYAIWAKMENSINGNTNLTPADWPAQFSNFNNGGSGGQFYVISQTGNKTSEAIPSLNSSTDVTSKTHPKVKRPAGQ